MYLLPTVLIANLLQNPDFYGAIPLDCEPSTTPTESSSLFFIDGPGGTGKTFTENLLLSYVRGHRNIALSVASSGIAALLLLNGRTAHSRFKIPLQLDSQSRCPVSVQTDLAQLFRRTDLIIWDEAPAQHRNCFMAVDRMLRDVRNRDEWFGGITTIFSGKLPQSYHSTCLTHFR
jgi:ATP-dependent DNA helicase PIF1